MKQGASIGRALSFGDRGAASRASPKGELNHDAELELITLRAWS
jgi:hypothetical protein